MIVGDDQIMKTAQVLDTTPGEQADFTDLPEETYAVASAKEFFLIGGEGSKIQKGFHNEPEKLLTMLECKGNIQSIDL